MRVDGGQLSVEGGDFVHIYEALRPLLTKSINYNMISSSDPDFLFEITVYKDHIRLVENVKERKKWLLLS